MIDRQKFQNKCQYSHRDLLRGSYDISQIISKCTFPIRAIDGKITNNIRLSVRFLHTVLMQFYFILLDGNLMYDILYYVRTFYLRRITQEKSFFCFTKVNYTVGLFRWKVLHKYYMK